MIQGLDLGWAGAKVTSPLAVLSDEHVTRGPLVLIEGVVAANARLVDHLWPVRVAVALPLPAEESGE